MVCHCGIENMTVVGVNKWRSSVSVGVWKETTPTTVVREHVQLNLTWQELTSGRSWIVLDIDLKKSVCRYKQSSTNIQRKVAVVLDPPQASATSSKRSFDNFMETEYKEEFVIKKIKHEGSMSTSTDITSASYLSINNMFEEWPLFSNCNISFHLK